MIETSTLQLVPLFTALQPETLRVLSNRLFQRQIEAGSTLLIEGEPAESCYFLLSGEVRVLRMNAEGRVQTLSRIAPGEPINLISLLTTKRLNRATVEALSPISVLVLTQPDFNHLLERHPDFSSMCLHVLADRMARVTDLAAGLSLYTVRARLAKFLINLAEAPPDATGWTQEEIAAQIGTVRDVVGRILREFEANQLIRRHGHQVILLDREGLYREADEDPVQ